MKTSKLLEIASGYGEVRAAGAYLAKVFYHLQVRQEIGSESPALPSHQPIEIAGDMTISPNETVQANMVHRAGTGELLTLYLGDGRHLDVYATQSAAFSNAYRIVPATRAGFMHEPPTTSHVL